MSVVHESENPSATASRYSVTNMNILQVEITLEYVWEGQDTNWVENNN